MDKEGDGLLDGRLGSNLTVYVVIRLNNHRHLTSLSTLFQR
jgi:hypothetical protein